MNIDIFSVLIFLGLVQGLFLSVLLLSKSSHLHRILGVILLVISIQIADFFSAYSLISLRYPHLIDISVPLGLANGPLIFLFYFYLAEKKYPRYAILHFIPFVIFLINQSFYYLQDPDFKFNSFVVSRNIDLPQRTQIEQHFKCRFDSYVFPDRTKFSAMFGKDQTFENLIKKEIDNKRPVGFYFIWDKGGHAIVLDGYTVKDGIFYVHANYGWMGHSDGWYVMPEDLPATTNLIMLLTIDPMKT